MLVRLVLNVVMQNDGDFLDVIQLYQPSCHSCYHFMISFKYVAANIFLQLWKRYRSASNSSEVLKISVGFSLQNYTSSKLTSRSIHLVVFEDTESRKSYNFKYIQTERGISM
jgi:hypothetical protein